MSMNEFRICADFIHLSAFLLLITKIYKNQSCADVSGKSQILMALVFTFRYLDLFTNFISIYNTTFKLAYILLAYFTLYLIFIKFRKTYDSNNDTFWNSLAILAVSMLALFVNYIVLVGNQYRIEFYWRYLENPLEIAWTFSIYLEAIAVLPQFHMIRKIRDGQTVAPYIIALTVYRALYVCNWIYRYYNENYLDLISSIAGTIQTVLLITVLIYIQTCAEKNPKWQEITKVFTIEGTKLDESKKQQPPTFVVNQSYQEEDTHRLLV